MGAALLISSANFAVVFFACLYSFYSFFHYPGFLGKKKKKEHTLDRHPHNPVISPLPYREWEANGTFNPGAVEDDDGHIHLFYRAIGADGLSRVSHARTADG